MRVLLVQPGDQKDQSLRTGMQAAGCLTFISHGGEHALRSCLQGFPDAVLIDTAVPDGLGLCRDMRHATWLDNLPVLFWAGKPSEEECLRCFDAGGNDYLSRLTSGKEVAARLEACVRVRVPVRDRLLRGQLEVNVVSRLVRYAGGIVQVSPMEFSLLTFLLLHPDVVFTREELIRGVWGPHSTIGARGVDVHLYRLRSKFEKIRPGSCPIEGVRGRGVTVRRAPGLCAQTVELGGIGNLRPPRTASGARRLASAHAT